MRRKVLILLLGALLAVPLWAAAQTKAGTPARYSRAGDGGCATCPRDAQGRIARSAAVRREFIRQNPCPNRRAHSRAIPAQGGLMASRSQCAGYQVDHRVPLHCGGKDVVANLQWLTVGEHRAKTKRERDCAAVPCPSVR